MEATTPTSINSDSMDYTTSEESHSERKVVTKRLPWGILPLVNVLPLNYIISRPKFVRGFVATLTFFVYVNYHMTRKVFSAVKSELAPGCSSNHSVNASCIENFSNLSNESLFEFDELTQLKHKHNACDATWKGWAPFDDKDECHTLLGSVDYSWSFAYAICMFFSGMIADRMNLRYFLTIGLIGSGIGTCLVGMAEFVKIHHLYYFILIQLLNGALQSTGWPGVVSVMGNWFGKKRRGFYMGAWNAHTSVGNILGTVIPAALLALPIGTHCYRWGFAFVVPGAIMVAMGVVVFLFLVIDPTDLGLDPPDHQNTHDPPPINPPPRPYSPSPQHPIRDEDVNDMNLNVANDEKRPLITDYDNDDKNKKVEPHRGGKRKSSVPGYIVNSNPYRIVIGGGEDGAIGFVGALMIPGVIEYSLSLFFAKLVAYTFLFWLPFYVKNSGLCLSEKVSDYLSTLFDVGGIWGGVFAGVFSDITNARALTCVMFQYLSVPVLYLYRVLGGDSVVMAVCMLFVTGFFVNAPYALITTAVSSDLGTHKSLQNNQKAKATVSAIIDGTGSIGAALGPLVVGWMSDKFGWNSVFYFLMGSCFLSAVLLTRLLFTETCGFIKKYIYSDIDKMCCGRFFFRK